MNDGEVTIVRLEPMRVASVRALGESPEDAAWAKLRPWAEAKGLLSDPIHHPVFGFDNPLPSEERKEYGYELWVQVGAEVQGEGEIEIKNFGGGLYAVMTCHVKGDPWAAIPAAWHKLDDWVKASPYVHGDHQHLERLRNLDAPLSDLVLDLYCPIKEKA